MLGKHSSVEIVVEELRKVGVGELGGKGSGAGEEDKTVVRWVELVGTKAGFGDRERGGGRVFGEGGFAVSAGVCVLRLVWRPGMRICDWLF